MADKAITDLNTIPGSVDDNNTWFAVAQSGTAYKVSGHEFTLALGTILDGHGGVKAIVLSKPLEEAKNTPPSLTGTMVITLADNSTTTVNVDNGKGISSIAKVSTAGLVDTYRITYNDSTTSTFTVTNGAKGDTGDSWFVWIKYAGSQPTQDSDMGDTPDDWIGIYSGTSSTAPTHYTDYDWFEYKGEKGDTGDAATITTQNVSYQESSSGTVAPSGSWTTTIPSVTPGNFLWTRTQLAFNDGTTVTSYSVSRYGIDGTGAVSTVNQISPDSGGNVSLTATDIPMSDNQSVQTHVADAEDDIAELKTSINQDQIIVKLTITANGTGTKTGITGMTADHVLDFIQFYTDSALTTPSPSYLADVDCTPGSGSLTVAVANKSQNCYALLGFSYKPTMYELTIS